MESNVQNNQQELETRALSFPEQAKQLQIVDQKSLDYASNFLISIKGMRKEIDETFDPGIKKAYEAHKAAVALKKKFETPLAEAEATVKPMIASCDLKTSVSGVSVRADRKFRIVDEAAIPRAYLSVDEKKIAAIIKALGEQANIPGIEFYEGTVVSVRA